jgi:signal transduction histidine kinase
VKSAPPGEIEAGLRRQANRLRFDDPALETAFREERLTAAATRTRVTLIAGMLAAAGIGVATVFSGVVREATDFHFMNLRLRFFGIVPAWLLMLGSTWLPGHRRRADWVNGAGTVLACWALALIYWHTAFIFPETAIWDAVWGGLMTLLLITAVVLPWSGRALGMTLGLALGGTLAFYALTLEAKPGNVQMLAANFTLIGAVIVLLAWYRESAERLMFAQREQMRRLNAELARLNAEKNEFMAIASHDLQSPLVSVHGLAGQLEAGQAENPAQAHAAIRALVRRMLDLVDNYLGAHAAESGMLPVRLERVDLRAQAAQAAERHGPAASAKSQRVEVGAGPAVWVAADVALLAQVTDNFTSNALKFSPHGARVQLEVLVAEDGSRARLAVIDEGPGVAPDEQAGLFRKFSRTAAKPTGGEASHGLGLAVTRRLAEAMGGTVGCDSASGAGATFWIELPRAE